MVLRDLGHQLSSDSLRRSAIHELMDHGPTAPIDASDVIETQTWDRSPL